MTTAERVSKWLREWKGYAHCDECIASALKLSRSAAQAAASALGTSHGYRRERAECYGCFRKKLVTRWRSIPN
jgi:hypothetical protein